MNTSHTALLIIDVQSGLFPTYRGDELLANISQLLTKAHEATIPVIYVQHSEDHPQSPLRFQSEGWQIHPAIAPRPDETIIHKKTSSSFYKTNLQEVLTERGIQKLVIAGLQTDWCIDTTTRHASLLDYEVTLVSDSHSTEDSDTLTAAQIVEHHNNLLSGFSTLKKAEEISFAEDRREQ